MDDHDAVILDSLHGNSGIVKNAISDDKLKRINTIIENVKAKHIKKKKENT